uniref:RepA n=1 Tax=Leifsonia xyli subsp. cynodontis TaxID=31966 RepID=Q6EEG5_LEIXC|nr:RepA [Leifsonia xyli subsp. cynodontis]
MRGTSAKKRRRQLAAASASRRPRELPATAVRSAGELFDQLQQFAQAAPPAPEGRVRETSSWSIPIDPGAWAAVPCWRSRQHWLDTLLDLQTAHDPRWLEARTRWKMAARTVFAIAYVLAHAADRETGRHVTVFYDTVRARVLANTTAAPGRPIRLTSNSAIAKAIKMLEHIGLIRFMATGRNFLSREEKAEAFHTHGGQQAAAANVFACTLPQHLAAPADSAQTTADGAAPAPAQAVENSGPTSPISALSPLRSPNLPSSENLHHPSQGGLERPTGAQPGQKRVFREDASANVPESGRSLHRQVLLARLDQWSSGKPLVLHPHAARPADGDLPRGSLSAEKPGKKVPWRRNHIGRVEKALEAAGVDLDHWQWWQIVEQLERAYATNKLTAAQRIASSGDPLAYFTWMIRNTIAPGDDPRTIVPYTPWNPAYQPATPPADQAPAPSPAPTLAERQAIDTTIQTMRDDAAAARDARRHQLHIDRRQLTDVLLGEGKHPSDFPTIVRDLHNEIQTLHERLTNHGWTLDRDELHRGEIRWTNETTRTTRPQPSGAEAVTSIRFITPEHAGIHHHYNLNQAGTPNTFLRLTLPQLHAALDRSRL